MIPRLMHWTAIYFIVVLVQKISQGPEPRQINVLLLLQVFPKKFDLKIVFSLHLSVLVCLKYILLPFSGNGMTVDKEDKLCEQ